VSHRFKEYADDNVHWSRLMARHYPADAPFLASSTVFSAPLSAVPHRRRLAAWTRTQACWGAKWPTLRTSPRSTDAGASSSASSSSSPGPVPAPTRIVADLSSDPIFCVSAVGDESFVVSGSDGRVSLLQYALMPGAGAAAAGGDDSGSSGEGSSPSSPPTLRAVVKASWIAHPSGMLGMSSDPASQLVATGSFDGTASVWRLNWRRQREIAGLSVKQLKQALAAKGIPIEDLREKQELVARLARATPLAERLCRMDLSHGNTIVSTSVSGRTAMTGSRDGIARVWRVPGDEGGAGAATSSSSSSSGMAEELLALRGHDPGVDAVHLDPRWGRAVTGGKDGMVRVWDLKGGGREVGRFDLGDCWVWMVKTGATWHDSAGHEPGMPRHGTEWDGATDRAPPYGSSAGAGADDVNENDGDGADDGERELEELGDGAFSYVRPSDPVHLAAGAEGGARAGRFLGDGWSVAAGTTNGDLALFDLRSKAKVHQVRISSRHSVMGAGQRAPITGVAPTFSAHRFVTSSFDGVLRVWDERTWRPVLTLAGPRERLTRCEVSPTLAVAGCMDGTVQAWSFMSSADRAEMGGAGL
jgi:WD40 repeat protein